MNYKFKVGDRVTLKDNAVERYKSGSIHPGLSYTIIFIQDEETGVAWVFPGNMWVLLEDFEPIFSSMLKKVLK